MIPPLHEAPLKHYCGGIVKTAPFGQVKDALSASASSMIIRPTGEEFYSRYIWWSIIGGVSGVAKVPKVMGQHLNIKIHVGAISVHHQI